MGVSGGSSLWDGVVELTKAAQEKGSDPLVWAIQVNSNLNSAGESVPSPELANVLVSYICWENNLPIMWKFLEKALTFKIVPPMLALAMLSLRLLLFSFDFPIFFSISVFLFFFVSGEQLVGFFIAGELGYIFPFVLTTN